MYVCIWCNSRDSSKMRNCIGSPPPFSFIFSASSSSHLSILIIIIIIHQQKEP